MHLQAANTDRLLLRVRYLEWGLGGEERGRGEGMVRLEFGNRSCQKVFQISKIEMIISQIVDLLQSYISIYDMNFGQLKHSIIQCDHIFWSIRFAVSDHFLSKIIKFLKINIYASFHRDNLMYKTPLKYYIS